jgi:glutamine synthetase
MNEEKLDSIINEALEKNVKLLRLLYIDLDNVIRGHEAVVDSDKLRDELLDGMAYVGIMQSGFTLFDNVTPGTIYGPQGEVRLIPDLSTFRVLPYAKNTAQVIGDFMTPDLKPFEVDPRPLLKKYLSNVEYDVYVGIEPELYFFKKESLPNLEPMDKHLCFATSGMNAAEDIVLEIIRYAEMMDLPLYHYYPEYGKGQHEFSLRPLKALEAADAVIMFRELVRAVANKYGLIASFMPKPSNDLPGSGFHVHVSLWKDGVNLFYDEKDTYLLSDLAYHFIGGLLKHLDSLIAITAASVNSYKRLLPHNWASAFKCWGPQNREAAIRIPLPSKDHPEKSIHLEIKFVDATAQPYLMIGSIIAAGLDGVRNKIDPSEPCLEDPAELSDVERRKRGWDRYPEFLIDAIRNLEKDRFFRDVWGDTLIDEYVRIKKYHWYLYHNTVTQLERKYYLEAY